MFEYKNYPTIQSFSQIERLLDKQGLPFLKEHLLSTAVPCYRVELNKLILREAKIGESKLGGLPQLPPGFPWPNKDGRQLMFIAQLNLSEIEHDHVPDFPLPKHGLLTFWFDIAGYPGGYRSTDLNGFQVHYFDDITHLRIRDLPELDISKLENAPCSPWTPFGEKYVRAIPSYRLNLDAIEDVDLHEAGISDEEFEQRRYEWYDTLDPILFPEPQHQLLGKPYVIQEPMEHYCHRLTNDLPLHGKLDRADQERLDALTTHENDWRLIFQIDSHKDPTDWMWGDCGMLYYWIKDQDLRARDFSKIWGMLQCC